MLLAKPSVLLSVALFIAVGCGDTGSESNKNNDPGLAGCANGQECASGCTDVLADAVNCGACGVTCGVQELCSAGACVPASQGCGVGFAACEGACVDTSASTFHCGACGSVCAEGQTCSVGACVGTPTGTGGGTSTGGTSGTGGSGLPASTEVVIEEGGVGQCSVDGIVESSNAGYSGSGYLNANNALGAGIEWAVSVTEAGTYSLKFVYANGATDRPGDVVVGDSVASAAVSFPSTTEWSTWSTVTLDVSLAAGENRISLEATSDDGLANIDSLTITGAAISAFDCGGNAGTGGNAGSGGAPGTGEPQVQAALRALVGRQEGAILRMSGRVTDRPMSTTTLWMVPATATRSTEPGTILFRTLSGMPWAAVIAPSWFCRAAT